VFHTAVGVGILARHAGDTTASLSRSSRISAVFPDLSTARANDNGLHPARSTSLKVRFHYAVRFETALSREWESLEKRLTTARAADAVRTEVEKRCATYNTPA